MKPGERRRGQARSPWLGATFALFVGLITTAGIWYRSRSDEALKFQSNFEYRVFDAQDRIMKRMSAMEQVLWGVRAVFTSSDEIERAQFREYVSSLDLPRHSPGIQALGFVKRVKSGDLPQHLKAVQESMPTYEVRPPGDRDQYGLVMFIAPFEGRNLVALGFDMLTEPVRREAMERARDAGETALSGRVRLVQEPQSEHQAGALIYVPVYARGPQPVSLAERQERLEGWAYVAFRMDDLMHATLDGRPEIATRIYDGTRLARETLLFDSMADQPQEPVRPGLVAEREIVIAGRPWTLVMEARALFGQTFSSRTPRVVALGGSVLSVVLAMLVYVLMGARARAELRARTMNAELIEAHAAVEESEQRLRLALLGSNVASWDYSADGDRVIVGERLPQMLGLPADQVEWKTEDLAAFAHPDDRPALAEAMKRHLTGKTPSFQVEARARHADGHWVWILLSGKVVAHGPDGIPRRAAGTLMDLTERKRAEAERAMLVERFHRAERAASMGTLASGMAHEINNPLAVVLASVAFAQHELAGVRDGPKLEEARAALTDANDAAMRVRDLVADLNAFTDQQLVPHAISELASVLKRADEHSRMANPRGASVVIDLPPLPPVRGAEPELVQLFVALLTNALQATGDHHNEVRIRAERRGHQVIVTVRDQGVGMKPDVLAQVFDPFYTTRAPGLGKGLGLPTALSIARGVGGNLELESVEGEGTTATVTLVDAEWARLQGQRG